MCGPVRPSPTAPYSAPRRPRASPQKATSWPWEANKHRPLWGWQRGLYSLPKRTEWTAEHTKEEHVNEIGAQTNAAEVPGLRTRVRRVSDAQRALRRERIGAGDDRLRPRPGRLPQLPITQGCSAGRAP